MSSQFTFRPAEGGRGLSQQHFWILEVTDGTGLLHVKSYSDQNSGKRKHE